MIIASDIHDSTENRTLHDALEFAVENDPDRTLIVAGDFTKRAGNKEYTRTAIWLANLMHNGVNVVVTVGNHDMSQSIFVARVPLKKGYRRFSRLMDMLSMQDCLVARRDCFDAVYRIGKDVFVSARSIHSRVYKGSRLSKDQYKWAARALIGNGLTTENGYRLHLLTHQSLWKLEGDPHNHMNKRRRLVKSFLEPFGFSTAINGHNHRFDHGRRSVKKKLQHSLYHIQAPTLSSRTKGRFIPGFVSWDPSREMSAELKKVY